MLYLCQMKDCYLIAYAAFKNERELAAYLTYTAIYDNIVANQNLSGNDTVYVRDLVGCKIVTTIAVPIFESRYVPRTTRLVDEHGRILDIRNFEHLLPGDEATYNAWRERTILKPRREERCRRQGRTHRKGYHYLSMASKWETDAESIDYNNIRHINRIRTHNTQSPYDDMLEISENNWKSAKVAHQYMWHKPRHKSMLQNNCPIVDDDAEFDTMSFLGLE